MGEKFKILSFTNETVKDNPEKVLRGTEVLCFPHPSRVAIQTQMILVYVHTQS